MSKMHKRDKSRDKDKMEHLDQTSKELYRQYRAISAKMRKRFLKKPNFPEASKEFGRLGNAVRHSENHDFAAACFSAMAKCDQLMGDGSGEAESWAMAGREFIAAEELLYSGRHVTYWDSLEAAIHCFLLAIRAQEKQGLNVMAAMYCLEIGEKCMYFEKYSQATRFLQQASDLQKDLPECRLQTLTKLAKCKVIIRDYDSALAVYAKVTAETRAIIKERDLKRGPFVRCCFENEVSQLILLLMLKFPRRSLKKEHIELLERYSRDVLDPTTFHTQMNKERYLLLQSLISACETKDYKEIEAIQTRIWDFLDLDQQHLYQLLMETHSTKQLPIL